MPELHYRDAQRLGQREYRACIAAGIFPYLPALDDFIPSEQSAAGKDLGLVSIPAEFIAGTKTRGRTNAFARNYMPLLSPASEFAVKWERLCQSHLEEGIRDPVKVYEYLNRFYVEEGNKRVSVLKYFGAVQIAAQVIRVMPAESDTPEVQRYLEFVRMSSLTGIGFIEFTKKESYARFLTKLGKTPDEPWTEEERCRLSSAYYTFRSAFEAAGGAKLHVTTGDAFLAFLEIHDAASLSGMGTDELKKAITGMWEELKLLQEKPTIEVKAAPEEEKKHAFALPRLASKPLRIAFFYDRDPEISEWANNHEKGRLSVQQAFEGRIETSVYKGLMGADARGIMEAAVQEGNSVLFTTSPRLLPASLQTAVSHPEVMVFNCSLNQSHRYIRTYYPRIHEARFILGAVAGAIADGEEIGYICDYPIYGEIAGINAFALGAQMVNPKVRIVLVWSDAEGHARAKEKLTARGIRLYSSQHLSRQPDGSFGVNGVALAEGGETRVLASPEWKWDVYYEKIIGRILDGSSREEYESSPKAINYYWGLSSGVVDVRCSASLPDGVRKLVSYIRKAIADGSCDPFAYPFTCQDGRIPGRQGEQLSPQEIMEMDYLVSNVIGSIPEAGELRGYGRATLDVMGVKP